MSNDPLERWREQSRNMPFPPAVPPPPPSYEDAVSAALADLRKEIAGLRDVIYGRPDIPGWQGALVRVEGCEKRLEDLGRIQEEFVRDRKAAETAREKKEAGRIRIVGAALSVGGTLLVTVVIAVFKILVTVGTKAPP